MLEIIYNSWEIIAVISTVVGVVSALGGFGKFFSKQKELPKAVRILGVALFTVASILVCITAIVGSIFTEVPQLCGGNAKEAESELHKAKLDIVLEPGVRLEDNWTSEVTGQSVDAHRIVLKNTDVIVYLKGVRLDAVDIQGVVEVPQVVGMEQIEATELLNESGLQFQVWWTEENNVDSEQYYIIGQSILAGSEVPAGTLVKLELSPNKP